MDIANIAQLSKKSWRPTHSIALQSCAPQERRLCHLVSVRHAHHTLSPEVSIALNSNAIQTSSWMSSVSAINAQQDTSKLQTKEDANMSLAQLEAIVSLLSRVTASHAQTSQLSLQMQ